MNRLRVLARPLVDRNYRLLWLSQVLSEAGDWAARLALTVLVLDRTGSATWAGVAVGASLVTWLGPGQLVAAAVDRFDRRAVMVGSDVVRAAAFGLMLVPAPVGVTVALAALAGLATPAFAGSRSAAMIEVVPPAQYGPAIALTGVTQDMTVLLGYLFGGLTLVVADPSTAIAVNACTFAASALVLRGLPALPSRATAHPDGAGAAGRTAAEATGLRASVRFIRADARVRRAVLLTIAGTFSATAAETLLVVHTVQDLGAPSWVAAALLAAAVLLTLVGTALVPLHGTSERLLRVAALLTLVPASVIVVLTWAGSWAASVGFVLAGLLLVATTPANIVGGPRLPKHLRAVAISVIVGATIGGQAVAAALAGVLADSVDVRPALALCMAPAVLVGLVCVLRPLPVEVVRDVLDEPGRPDQPGQPVGVGPTGQARVRDRDRDQRR